MLVFKRVLGYIDSGKSDGATVQTGGSRHGDEGFFVKPTLFTDVSPSMKIAQEEIFGPVAAVIKFKTEDGAFQET
jgi:aldehyde dehydrogenase (NAD+)